MLKPTDVTIIIPHLGATKEQCYSLTQCLESLKENSPEIRVLVVKNGNKACQCRRDLRILEQGQCKAVNAAVVTTNTPWIFITNDDMIYPPGWWDNLVNNLTDDIWCVSPQLIEPRQGAPTFEVYFCGGAGGDFDKPKFYEYVVRREKKLDPLRRGFNFPLLIRRELFDLVNMYDIKYDPWSASSDTDLQCKIELAGVETYQNQDCIIYHFSQTSGTFEPKNHGYWAKNYAYFQEKWGFERPGDPDVWFSKDLIKYDKLIYHPWWENFYKKKKTIEG